MPDISTPNLDYGQMTQAWDINDALMGGTLFMRTLGESYLPKWPNEELVAYRHRLSVATLLPAYEETISQNVGRVFAEPVKLSDDTPDAIVKSADNFDMAGNRLDVWAQEYFRMASQYGLAHALVDFPRVDRSETRTRADEKARGLRPYATLINPRQVIGWESEVRDGMTVLTELRIKEVVIEKSGDFGQKKIEQIRYLTPGKVEIYRKSTGVDGAAVWLVYDAWDTSRKDISLVTLYTKRTGFLCGTPPLLNLALLNIKHWQSQSEQDNILHVARVPILSVFGLKEGQELTIGASSATQFSDRAKQGVEYTEHSGAAVGSGETSLEKLEQQMRMAGAKLLRVENTSTKSVDQTNEERMQEHSPLYTMANSLEDALDNILQIMAEWMGLDNGGNVDVRTELDTAEQTLNAPAVLAIQSLRQGGDIRPVDAVRALQNLRVIDPDAKPEDVVTELNNLTPSMIGDSDEKDQ
ncbi:DUF4055 domain-containing protein [Pantoea coffeiphila]|uniref:DNA-binding protein n=1 Tax=Pantoea coffeiphila TaxID=1465635 RepID=A0A2S9I8D0_9GAMM|nr:DUF4055 domain-containing protein [Pantoea coffeiphila]PRD13984.1 DNA-binding protein [Pantoea coffeiphila]